MRAKTLTIVFVLSLAVAAIVALRAIPHKVDASPQLAARDQILVAANTLPLGTLLRDQDVAWQAIDRAPEATEFVRPSAAARDAKPELDDQARAAVYGTALRGAISGAATRTAIAKGDAIRRGEIVKPGDRDFLQVVLSPGARAIAIPVATGGASTGLLYPGDRVDVVLTQKFNDGALPLTRRSVSETVVENLRVLAIDALDAKAPDSAFGRTVTLEVTPEQAEKVDVATELGKLSLTLRSLSSGLVAATTPGSGQATPGHGTDVRPTWAGDVSPALGGATPPEKMVTAEQPPVVVLHGIKPEKVRE